MDFFQFVIIFLHITKALSKKKYTSSSEESIENLLYYKDCQHRRSPTTATPNQPLKQAEKVRENPCPYPKMCCSISCDDQCNSGMSSMSGMSGMSGMSSMSMGGMNGMLPRHQDMMQPIMQSVNPTPPRQPHFIPPQPGIKMRARKKPFKPADLLPPIGGRREFGFTKEKIKSLISQDGDIRKILKDLVRVTMQKVDLVDMVNSRRSDGGGDKENEPDQNDDELE